MKRLLFSVLVLLSGAIAASAETLINGAGARFPQPLYQRWFEKYTQVDASVRFNYIGVGSTGGRNMMLGGVVDFGASDSPIPAAEQAKAGRTIWHLPSAASAVAVCHSLKGFPDVQLDGATVAAIFLGQIQRWNDPAIAAHNPGKRLPDRAIVVLHPLEHGTLTDYFSEYLTTASPAWHDKYGAGGEVAWPAGPGATGNQGVAKLLRETPDAIAFLELSVANRANVRIVALRNAAGHYVRPDLDTVGEAAATATLAEDFHLSLLNAPGAKAYPIGIVTWLLVNPHFKSPTKERKMAAFLKWAYRDGEAMAPSVGLVPMPDVVREKVLARIGELKG